MNPYILQISSSYLLHILGITSLLLMSSGSVLQAQINSDSILQKAAGITPLREQLAYLDSICQALHTTTEKNAGPIFDAQMKLATTLGDLESNALRAANGADYFHGQGLGEKGKALLAPYLNKVDRIQQLNIKVRVLDIQGRIHTDAFEFEPAIELLQRVVSYYEQGLEAPEVEQSRAYRNLGKNLWGTGDYGASLVALNKSKALAISAKDSTSIMDTYISLGNLYGRIGLYDEAITNFKKRYQYESEPSEITLAYDAANFGRAYLEQKKYALAINSYQDGLRLSPLPDDFKFATLYHINGLIECYFYLNQPDSVLLYANQLEASFREQEQPEFFDFLIQQSRFFEAVARQQYAKAEKILQSLYAKALENNDDGELMAYAFQFSELYRRWKKPALALQYLDSYNQVYDSIRTANKTHALLMYQTEYETKEKEQTILQLRTENEIQALQADKTRNRYLLGGLALMLVSGLAFMRQYFHHKIQQAQKVEQLRSKISRDLHDDVGSILTGLSMQSEVLEQSLPVAQRGSISGLAEMSRSALSRMRDTVWAMDAKKDNWNSLIDRMNEFCFEILAPQDIHFRMETSELKQEQVIPGDLRQNIYLIFKEAITNIAKHARASEVEIITKNRQQAFYLRIKDNGPGRQKNYTTTGSGLNNMKKRAEEIGGRVDFSFHDGFIVKLEGPANAAS